MNQLISGGPILYENGWIWGTSILGHLHLHPGPRGRHHAEVETSQHHAAPLIPSRWKQRPDGCKLQWIKRCNGMKPTTSMWLNHKIPLQWLKTQKDIALTKSKWLRGFNPSESKVDWDHQRRFASNGSVMYTCVYIYIYIEIIVEVLLFNHKTFNLTNNYDVIQANSCGKPWWFPPHVPEVPVDFPFN